MTALLNATKDLGARWYARSTIERQDEGSAGLPSGAHLKPKVDLDKIPRRQRADAWLGLLEPALPPHLRQQDSIQAETALNPTEIFEILSAAEKITLANYNQDVLSYIAFEKKRWSVTVWLVKHLVESFAVRSSSEALAMNLLCMWKNDTPLEELTTAPVDAQHPDFLHYWAQEPDSVSLADATQSHDRNQQLSEKTLRRDCLGMIWRALGNMTMTCANGEIQPEILEIIAFLHHHEFMPSTIYDAKPNQDPTAIQQSPILNLLSSRILTSLSDAAWRAHERLVVEEAKSNGGSYASLRPEIPGTAYRVRVAGLKPEVWLELILWSCLHGGWVAEGVSILEKLHDTQRNHQWKPLSWRSLVSQQPEDTRDWERVEYLFNNWAPSSMDLEEPLTPVSVSRTVSSEIVNAYVDASISITRTSAGDRGRSVFQTIKFLNKMQKFLSRASLSLGAGSWDAILLRLFDLQDATAYKPTIFDSVIRLSPTMGQEIEASNVRGLPDYVFDGTAAVFGLFHRALYHRIKEADVEGALRLFSSLQERADENKRQSVADFLQKRNVFGGEDVDSGPGPFSDNYGSIDYPAFYIQIPPTILGPFLELVTDAKAYDFGKWLIYSDEIDGPIISRDLYGDSSLTPSLIRFAAETGDKKLLSRLIQIRASSAAQDEQTLPRKVLQSFLESQINLQRWDAAVKILQHMKDSYGFGWNTMTLCHLLRVSLEQVRHAESGDEKAKENMNRARGIFRQLVQGGYDRIGERPDFVQEQIDNLLVMLASIGGDWTGFSINTQAVKGHRVFNIPSKGFNLVLGGVVDAYGSRIGRKLIGLFWSHQVRYAQSNESESDRRVTNPPFSSFGRTLPDHIRRQRTEIFFPGSSNRKVVMYGGLHPDLMTIRIVLRRAIQELIDAKAEETGVGNNSVRPADSQSEVVETDRDELSERTRPEVDVTPAGMAVWGIRCLKRLGMAADDAEAELRESLSQSKIDYILAKSPGLFAANEDGTDEGELEAKTESEEEGNHEIPVERSLDK